MSFRLALLGFVLIAGVCIAAEGEGSSRRFEFIYESAVTDITEGARTIELWAPVPRGSMEQEVFLDPDTIPDGAVLGTEKRFGNRILYCRFNAPFDAAPSIKLRYVIRRLEVAIEPAKALVTTRHSPANPELQRYLGPDRMVPIDGRIAEIADELKLGTLEPLKAARRAYDYVIDLMDYDKTKPGWGRGDALWACDAKSGNCSDFHSVFIGLVRSQRIPAKFEIGFPLPPLETQGEIGGYHCWSWFHVNGIGWVPVDASEADKFPKMRDYYFGAHTPDRVAFSTGRDLILEPPQKGEPLNFFIYPHVEIDGRPHESLEKRFTFKDL